MLQKNHWRPYPIFEVFQTAATLYFLDWLAVYVNKTRQQFVLGHWSDVIWPLLILDVEKINKVANHPHSVPVSTSLWLMTSWCQLNVKKKGSQSRSLGNSLMYRSRVWHFTANFDALVPSRQVASKPFHHFLRHSKSAEFLEEEEVIDTIKSLW